MIKKGDLIMFYGPEFYFKNKLVWTTESFLSYSDISFYISSNEMYVVIDIFKTSGYHDNYHSNKWYNIMEPHGICGWWWDAKLSINENYEAVRVKKVSD
jgi:hypothetical protein